MASTAPMTRFQWEKRRLLTFWSLWNVFVQQGWAQLTFVVANADYSKFRSGCRCNTGWSRRPTPFQLTVWYIAEYAIVDRRLWIPVVLRHQGRIAALPSSLIQQAHFSVTDLFPSPRQISNGLILILLIRMSLISSISFIIPRYHLLTFFTHQVSSLADFNVI